MNGRVVADRSASQSTVRDERAEAVRDEDHGSVFDARLADRGEKSFLCCASTRRIADVEQVTSKATHFHVGAGAVASHDRQNAGQPKDDVGKAVTLPLLVGDGIAST